MKRGYKFLAIATLLLLIGCSQAPMPTAVVPPSQAPAKAGATLEAFVPGSYIVVISSDLQQDQTIAARRLDEIISTLKTRYAFNVTQRYDACLLGFAATMTTETAAILGMDPSIQSLEQDRYMKACSQTTPTGMTRIGATKSSTKSGNGSGTVSGVDIYIIDSGIQLNHPDLNVVGGVSYVTGQTSWDDTNGHGTHVAGTAAAKDNTSYVVGVAPGADLYSVCVLNSTGAGQLSWILSGVNWVTARKNASPSRPMVANMSISTYCGTSSYLSLDNGVKNSITAGVTYVIAAGNDNANALYYTPSHVSEAITVGAYDPSNSGWATFSNWGSVVDILAPGVNILSTYFGTSTYTMSGTSMSAPHVTGTIALYLSTHTTATPATVWNDLYYAATHPANGTNSTISSVPSGTVNVSVWAANF